MQKNTSTKIVEFRWMVHALSATGAILGLYSLWAIATGNYKLAFILMFAAIGVDGLDGPLARALDVKRHIKNLDGALLDNLVDYLNYVIVPAFLLTIDNHLLAGFSRYAIPAIIVFVSSFGFSFAEAKTKDNFFLGFPSYWNIIVFCLFVSGTSASFNAIFLFLLAIGVFVPIKYVHPSRLAYVFPHPALKIGFFALTLLFFASLLALLFGYPKSNVLASIYAALYGVIYMCVSLYRTFKPQQ